MNGVAFIGHFQYTIHMSRKADTTITLQAPAKINLTLEALARREDGYHEIISIIQTVNLFDTLTLAPSKDISLKCNLIELESPDNLALKAAHLLGKRIGCKKGVRIYLNKSIPLSSGLGGGSSNAAAILIGLNLLWDLNLTDLDLSRVAEQLGSDVPFFLTGGTAMISGRGEKVRKLSNSVLKWVVILTPSIKIDGKTKISYAKLNSSHFTSGSLTRKLEARLRGGGDLPPQLLFNVFDSTARESFPGLSKYWDIFSNLGAREIHVAGSGPSLYAFVPRKELGTAIQLLLEHTYGWESHLVSTSDSGILAT